MASDFEEYARQKAMAGAVAESWIKPFEQYFLSQCTDRENARILDFGFGDGRYYEYYSRYFDLNNVHGVEVSKLRVERAQARGWRNAIYLDPMTKLPYQDGYFDLANMVEVIEHIPSQQTSFYLSELQRVLRPTGMLMLTTPNYPVKRLYDVLDALQLRTWSRVKDDPTHVSFYNHGTLMRLLKQYFQDVEFFPYKEGKLYRYWKTEILCHKILALCVYNRRDTTDAEISVESGRRRIMNCLTMEL